MSKAVLMSVSPKQCYNIASGKQTVIVSKTKPKIETPFKVYIYCTIGKSQKDMLFFAKHDKETFVGEYLANGKVIGEFVCDKIDGFNYGVHEPYGATNWQDCYKGYPEELYDMEDTCLTVKEINNYGSGRFLYAWHISNIVIYDKPKGLDYFSKYIDCHRGKTCYDCVGCWDCQVTRPPQSWFYVEERDDT